MAKSVQIAGITIPTGVDVKSFPCLETVLQGFVSNKVTRVEAYRLDRDSKKMRLSVISIKVWSVAVMPVWAEDATGKRTIVPDAKTLMAYGLTAWARGFDRKTGEDIWGDESKDIMPLNIGMLSGATLLKVPAREKLNPPAGKMWIFPDCADNARFGPRAEFKQLAMGQLIGHGWADRLPMFILE